MTHELAARVRAAALRLRGMRVGAKTRIGSALRADRPRCVQLGSRCEIEHAVFFKCVRPEARLEIAESVFIGTGTEIDVALEVTVGAHTLIAPGVFITDHTHNFARSRRLDEQGTRSAPVKIGRDVWLGARSVILAGVTVGDGAIVGAGAVVTRDVPSFAIVAGVPARVVGERP